MNNNDFIETFINSCKDKNFHSDEEIINAANNEILEIDNLIKEKLKLKSVIKFLSKKKEIKQKEDIDEKLSKEILKIVKPEIEIETLLSKFDDIKSVKFCLKQMLKENLIQKVGNKIISEV